MVALWVFAACAEQGEGGSQRTVDPRFASPGALVDHIRALTEPDDPQFRAYYALFYPETEAQRDWATFAEESILPRAELDRAMRERFGEGLIEDIRARQGLWTLENLNLKEVTGDRAKAGFTSISGSESELQLVKIGERWWISGYTWEFYPSFDANKIADVAQSAVGLADDIDEITRLVNAGKIASAREAKQAFEGAFRRHMRGEPDTSDDM